jgi:plasmid maintenance system antidote protein VapI
MFNKNFFLDLMKNGGDTQQTLAKALGLHTSTLNRKINGKLAFMVPEVLFICKRYRLSEPVLHTIFFN